MKTSIECLKELITLLGEDWKQALNNFLQEDEKIQDVRMAEEIVEFLNVCKEEIIAEKTASLQKVEKLVNNDLLYKNIREYIDDVLEPYYVSAPLRTMEVREPGKALTVIEEIFKRSILRFDPDMPKRFEKFGFESEEAFIDFLNVFDAVCTFVVGKNLCRESIEEFIYVRTRLPKPVCLKLTELLDENFSQLKINYIIEKLNK